MHKFGTKDNLIGYFWARILENCCHISNYHLWICLTPKFCEEAKMLKFGTKNALFEYFWSKMSYLGIFGLEFKRKLMLYLKSAPSNLPKYREIMKIPKFGTKSVLFGYFWARILKSYCHTWNQHLQISVIVKLFEERKISKFGTKNALFGHFWARFLEKLLSYLESAPSNLCICKISRKNKMPKFGNKNAWFGYFWARIWKQ